MSFNFLRCHYPELLQHMRAQGYSERFIHDYEIVIKFVLSHAGLFEWDSYDDVYETYKAEELSSKTLTKYAGILGTLKQFEVNHVLPVHGHRDSILKKDKYSSLVDDFRIPIDIFIQEQRKIGNKESTISSVRKIGVSFFFSMQQRGCLTISSIKENDVLSYFKTENGTTRCGSATSNFLGRIIRAGFQWRQEKCKTLLNYLPQIPKSKKNIQYLKDDEIAKIRGILDDPDSGLSLRDRAVCTTLLFTGLRRGDVAELKFDDIDWENDTITVFQEKTGNTVFIPLLPILGNVIFDYIQHERPNIEDPHLFLSTRYSTPGSLMTGTAVGGIVRKVFGKAGIRQAQGDRKNPHLFRHHMAVTMLENGIPQPVITKALGHTSPASIVSYLSADFVHLKSCALSIEAYPAPEEVFEL